MAQRENVLARPLDEQQRPPAECVMPPHADLWANPPARARILGLLALERAQWEQYHLWFRTGADEQSKVLFSEVARSESRHALTLSSLLDPAAATLQRALALEQASLDLYALLAQEEPDADVRAGFEYLLLEVLEHAYQVATLLRAQGQDPAAVTQGKPPLRPGRPLDEQHMASFDAIKRPYDKDRVDPMTRARVRLAAAIASACHEDYRQLVTQTSDEDARKLFARIRAVKEAHVAFCESFLDPRESLSERLVSGEFTENTFYRRFLEEEGDATLKSVYRYQLADEVAHLTLWEDELRRIGQDPWPLTHGVPATSAAPLTLESLIARLLDTQLTRRSKGKSYVEIGKTLEAYS